MKEKKVLFIAPSCYPVTGAENIVNIKLLHALSSTGEFSIDLISKRQKWENYPSEDISKYGVVLDSINIVEVDNKINFSVLLQHLKASIKFGIIFKGCHWASNVLKIVKNLIKEKDYDYVVTKNSPSFLLGYYCKKKYGIKWVATWNDPYPTSYYPAPYNNDRKRPIIDNRIIAIMRLADIHIFPSQRIADYMNNYLKVDSKQIRIIPHVVYDNNLSQSHSDLDELKLIHTGNISKPRNPYNFLKGLRQFLDKNPSAKISFTILGKMDNNVKDMVDEFNLNDYVKLIAPVSYLESLEIVRNYDVAVIIEADCKDGIFLPTKVSDFLQTKIPIFGVSPAIGTINDLYNTGVVNYFAPVDSPEIIENEISKIYNDFLNKKITIPEPNLYHEASENSIIQQYISF